MRSDYYTPPDLLPHVDVASLVREVRRAQIRDISNGKIILYSWRKVVDGINTIWFVIGMHKNKPFEGYFHSTGELWDGSGLKPGWVPERRLASVKHNPFLSANTTATTEMKVYNELIDPQLWRLANGGDQGAMYELQVRGPEHWLPARPNAGKRGAGLGYVGFMQHGSPAERAAERAVAVERARRGADTTQEEREFQRWWENLAPWERDYWAKRWREEDKAQQEQEARARTARRAARKELFEGKKNPVRGNRGPRGGYTAWERAALPTHAFLVPETRSWPVSDKEHAEIAIQYMLRGFGDRSSYPLLIQRLAAKWPVAKNADIWRFYSRFREAIEEKSGQRMPTLQQLREAA